MGSLFNLIILIRELLKPCGDKMRISDLLDENAVEPNLKAKREEEVIRELVDILHKAKKIKNPQEILSALLEREKAAPTILGNGVAIPHATVEGIQKALACLAISKSEIDFESPDNKRPIRVIFLFLSPLEESETHLQILSRAEGLLQNEKL